MLLELAKPVALLLCLLSLCVVFHTAFLGFEDPQMILQPHRALDDRMLDSVLLLALSAGIAVIGGMIFREGETAPRPSLAATLPVRVFLWGAGIMPPLFFLARFLETHYIFTPKIHW